MSHGPAATGQQPLARSCVQASKPRRMRARTAGGSTHDAPSLAGSRPHKPTLQTWVTRRSRWEKTRLAARTSHAPNLEAGTCAHSPTHLGEQVEPLLLGGAAYDAPCLAPVHTNPPYRPATPPLEAGTVAQNCNRPHLGEQVEPLPLEGAAQQRGVRLWQLGVRARRQALGFFGDALQEHKR